MSRLNILVLGAAYGLLPAVRMHLAGHLVTVLCRPAEQAAIAGHGAIVSFLRRDGTADLTLDVPAALAPGQPGALGLQGPDLDLARFDIVFLAMSEPQFAAPEIAALMGRIGRSGLPVVSLLNALPPPFLHRLGTLDVEGLRPAYAAWDAWASLDPRQVTAASPDAQAIRSRPDSPNELSVTLASNFKVAPFGEAAHQALLDAIARDVSAHRIDGRPLPVRILAHPSLHVPLAKWPMLIAGNCRCIEADRRVRTIADAVGRDLALSREIYDQTLAIVRAIGAPDEVLVPFDHYARAAASLTRPSSFARAIAGGATAVERIDRIVQLSGRQVGRRVSEIDRIVDRVDALVGGASPPHA